MNLIIAKESALVTALLISEEIIKGPILDTFEILYPIALKFALLYPASTNWEVKNLDWDETAILFAKGEIQKSV